MHHLEIEAEEKRQAKMTSAVRHLDEIRKARAEAAMDNLRRREPVVDEKPAVDWSEAPEWANYWALDYDGAAYWYEAQPHKARGRSRYWRTTKTTEKVDHAPTFCWPAHRWKESLVCLRARKDLGYEQAKQPPDGPPNFRCIKQPNVEPGADDPVHHPSHANRQTTEFARTPADEVALEKLSQRFCQALDDTHDTVNSPAHYTTGDIECIEVLEQLAEDGHDFRILNAIKYLWRYRHKGGVESLAKARWYIERVINDG